MPLRCLGAALVCAGLLLSAGGCGVLENEGPPVADSTMTRLLVERHLLRTRLEISGAAPGLEDSIFATYGVSRNAFERTLDYYTRRPEAYNTLYDAVIDTLNVVRLEVRTPPDERTSAPSGLDTLR